MSRRQLTSGPKLRGCRRACAGYYCFLGAVTIFFKNCMTWDDIYYNFAHRIIIPVFSGTFRTLLICTPFWDRIKFEGSQAETIFKIRLLWHGIVAIYMQLKRVEIEKLNSFHHTIKEKKNFFTFNFKLFFFLKKKRLFKARGNIFIIQILIQRFCSILLLHTLSRNLSWSIKWNFVANFSLRPWHTKILTITRFRLKHNIFIFSELNY